MPNGVPLLLAALLGFAGGALFTALNLPLPWMLGSMSACLLGAIFRLPLRAPRLLLPPMRCVLGVLLGAAFTPALLGRAGELAGSLAMIVPYVVLSAAIGLPYYRFVARHDTTTAYFAAMPGGLNDMIIIGEAMGGDVRTVALAHAGRIFLIVFAVPLLIQVWSGQDLTAGGARNVVALTDLAWLDYVTLIMCAVVGYPLAAALRLPGAAIIGPALVSAIVHLVGLSAAKPPDALVALAQLVLGVGIGCRFAGVPLKGIARGLAEALGLVILLLGVTWLFASLTTWLFAVNPYGALLAFAPGGLAEMTLVSLALGIEVAYVACHHIFRIVVVIVLAPFAFRLFRSPPTTLVPQSHDARDG